MRRARRIHTSGLTLVEMMITVAILGLLIAVLLIWIRPSDDRRCRLEAQRLAAFLIEGEANAIMRDGPVRVEFTFADNKGIRQFRKSSASLTDQSWELDEKAKVHHVNSPVKIDSIETPLGGALKSGKAWLNFNGHRTPGGVAVLVLNDAIYSVVVPPQSQGEVKVIKGRTNLKDPKTFNRVKLSQLPELALNDPGGNGNSSGLPPSNFGGTDNLAGGNPPPPQTNEDPPPEIDDEPETQQPPEPSQPPAEPSAQQPEEEPEEEPEPDDEPDPECESHADCVATMGERGVCVGTGGVPAPDGPGGQPNTEDPSQNRCRVNLTGRGFRVRSAQVTKPDGFAAFLNGEVNKYIRQGDLNLTVYMQTLIEWAPDQAGGFSARYQAWSFNAASNSGTVSVPHPRFPTSLSESRPAPCGDGFTSCHDVISQEQTEEGVASKLAIWLPRPGATSTECSYQELQIVGTLNVNMLSNGTAQVRLKGEIRERAARRMNIKLPGRSLQPLKALFEEAGIPPTVDTNGDCLNDAWELEFEGPANPVAVQGNLHGSRENNPCEEFE